MTVGTATSAGSRIVVMPSVTMEAATRATSMATIHTGVPGTAAMTTSTTSNGRAPARRKP